MSITTLNQAEARFNLHRAADFLLFTRDRNELWTVLQVLKRLKDEIT